MTDPRGAVSVRLAARVADACPGDALEVIISLAGLEVPPRPAAKPRADQLADLRERFESTSSAVVARVHDLGGTTVATAWISSAIKAVVPVAAVAELAAIAEVQSLDLPSAL